MVAAGCSGGADHVDVVRLSEFLMQPHDHCDVALEIAEPPPARLRRSACLRIVEPRPSPDQLVRSQRPKLLPMPL